MNNNESFHEDNHAQTIELEPTPTTPKTLKLEKPFWDHDLVCRLCLEYIACILLGYNGLNATCIFARQLIIFFCILFSLRQSGSHFHYQVTLILIYRPHLKLDERVGYLQMLASLLGVCTGQLMNYAMYGKLDPPLLQSYEQNYIIMAFCLQALGTFIFQILNISLFEEHTSPTKDPVYFCFWMQGAVLLGIQTAFLSLGQINPTVSLATTITSSIVHGTDFVFSYDTLFHQTSTMLGSICAAFLYYGYIMKQDKFAYKNTKRLFKQFLNQP